jgi:N-acetylmuramoyl-L-alanine amidase
MKEIILIAGHGGVDKGATGVVYKGKQLHEADLTKLVRDNLYNCIKMYMSDYPKLKVKVLKDDDSLTLQGVINWLNVGLVPTEDRLIFDIHFNAFNKKATGTEVIIPISPSTKETQLAARIQKTSVEVLKLADRKVKTEDKTARKRLAIMRPKGENILWEVCFIDNESDVDSFFRNLSDLCIKQARNILDFCIIHSK